VIGGLSGRHADGVGVVHESRVVVLPVGLLLQNHAAGLRGDAARGRERGAQGEAGRRFVELGVDVVVDVREGFAGGGVREPAPRGEAAARAGAERRVPVRVVQGQIKVVSGQGLIAVVVVPIGTSGPQYLLVGVHLLLAAGGDGSDLDAGAREGLWRLHGGRGQQRGGAVLGVLGLIARRFGSRFVRVKALGRADHLGVRLHAMTREAQRLVVGDHRLGLAHIQDVKGRVVVRLQI